MPLSEIEQVAKPKMKEWLERVAKLEPMEVDEPPAITIRRMRDAVEVYEQ